ncbi:MULTISPECIES: formate dehydrogenase accessory sulfurtransferase FdhD [Nonomuraea]|uniref:Sulfur carrier protein FdhD n=1 Tax=Nonomuraea ferruginea TaxID=46174 RepID=A0ABT4TAP2_9ACTN|nr:MULTISPECIES: formate dehydrogenase accessory sulfurtransferase FdhD [Nonomuraea]MDA0646582.1 formate dehydrogenase accessory sulfurtransferase FdhD [Nonomuraea ferruginea]TXK42573.1 formate dehydrogenase accessory sulfurtransferase FdhD [Nonomuraea sp. C10]
MSRVSVKRRILRIRDAAPTRRIDSLAAEEPLEIRLDGTPLTVTMRTPGDDFDLAAGFLVSEGAVGSADDIATIRYCAGATADGQNTYNVLDVRLAPGVQAPAPRNFYTTSSCGVCGKASLEAVRTVARWAAHDDPVELGRATVAALPGRLRAAQRVFDRTGGLHAAGLFTAEGEPLCVREDVGRHNAVDKLLGWALRNGRLPLRGTVLMVSGRASFELVQKAVMGGVPVLAAVSAPSSLAVELAAEEGLTLIGFLRGDSMNVYAGEQRLDLTSGAGYGSAGVPPPR